MRNFLGSIWSDIAAQKYLELYLILIVIIAIFFADVFGIEISTALVEIVLAALAVLIYGMIETRRFNGQTELQFQEFENKLRNIENEYSYIHKTLSGIAQSSAYLKRNESYPSLLNAINNATTSIDIISYVNLGAADTKRNDFYRALEQAINIRKVTHQRIVWNLDQLRWLEHRFNENWDTFDEFSVKFYRPVFNTSTLTTFDLFDQKTVIFGQNWLLEGHLEIISDDVGRYFRGYFTTIWNESEWIKERGKPPDQEKLKELIHELNGS